MTRLLITLTAQHPDKRLTSLAIRIDAPKPEQAVLACALAAALAEHDVRLGEARVLHVTGPMLDGTEGTI